MAKVVICPISYVKFMSNVYVALWICDDGYSAIELRFLYSSSVVLLLRRFLQPWLHASENDNRYPNTNV